MEHRVNATFRIADCGLWTADLSTQVSAFVFTLPDT